MRHESRLSRRGATQLVFLSRFVVLALALASVAGCSRKEDAARAEATADSDAGEAAASAGSAAGAESAPAALVADASAKPAAPAGDGGARACGDKGQPDCPLQAWMRANATPPLRARDAAGLALAFDRMASLAPPGYTNWVSISKDAASAARAGELDAARAACRGCHDQYKAKYRKEHGLRPI